MDASSLQTRAVVEQQEQGNIREALGICCYLRKQIVSAKDDDDIKQRSEWARHAEPEEDEPSTPGCVRKAGFFLTMNFSTYYLFSGLITKKYISLL